ncbi:MAG: hypothetical protein HZRFUVUK_000530 [Candidatus Fervidibacterota bacterium]|jgi:hypothetical protein
MRLIALTGILMLVLLVIVATMSTKTIQVVGRVAVVKFVSGKAYVERFGLKGRKTPLKKGMLVKTFDVVHTEEDGRIILHWVDGFQIELKPNTTLRILRSSFDKGKKTTTSLFLLRSGEVLTRFERKLTPGSTFEIRTPIVVAAVRGTEFGMRIDNDGSVVVKVYSGVVVLNIASGGVRLEVEGGKMVHINSNGTYSISEIT